VIDGKPMIESIIKNKPVRNTFYAFAPQKEVQGVRYNNWKLVLDKRSGKDILLLFNLASVCKRKKQYCGGPSGYCGCFICISFTSTKSSGRKQTPFGNKFI